MKSVTVKSGEGSFEVSGLDSEKNYLLAVESTTAKKGGGTDYSLDVACLNVSSVQLTGWQSAAVNLDRYEQPSLSGYTSDSVSAVSVALESSWDRRDEEEPRADRLTRTVESGYNRGRAVAPCNESAEEYSGWRGVTAAAESQNEIMSLSRLK